MVNFVIVEDNKLQVRKTKEIINVYMFKKNMEYSIDEFNDYDFETKDYIAKNDKHKIYILDFELPSANAIDVAREIRKNDWESAIIILSVHGGMAYETFKQRLQILDFVSKQYEAEKNLKELFDICLSQSEGKKLLVFRTNNTDYRIEYDKILYIYKNENRKSVIVTDSGEYQTYISLKSLNEKMQKKLVKTHKACLVNLDRVVKIDWKNKIILFDNDTESYLVSSNHKEEVYSYAI